MKLEYCYAYFMAPVDFRKHIATIPDFPKPGVQFYDISPLLADGAAWRAAIAAMTDKIAPQNPDMIVGIESRGFLLAAPLAFHMGIGFAMVRKMGKLPGNTLRYSYNLEYGNATLEIQDKAVKPGQRIVVVDDILATGGTMEAAIHLLRKIGANVQSAGFLIALCALNGKQKLDIPIHSLLEL